MARKNRRKPRVQKNMASCLYAKGVAGGPARAPRRFRGRRVRQAAEPYTGIGPPVNPASEGQGRRAGKEGNLGRRKIGEEGPPGPYPPAVLDRARVEREMKT